MSSSTATPPTQRFAVNGGARAYADKDISYFAGARRDIVELLNTDESAAILEIGCGQGRTGSLALSSGKCGSYCGVELFEGAAAEASRRLTEVIVGDVEHVQLPWPAASFDALIMSEVLEHLVDPWATLRRLRPLLKTGSLVIASSPNAAHYGFVLMLLRGDWRTADFGPMDRTHLRWFTPRSYREMFESCGFVVNEIINVDRHGWKAKALIGLSLGSMFHLMTRQIMLRGHVA